LAEPNAAFQTQEEALPLNERDINASTAGSAAYRACFDGADSDCERYALPQ
jgi:hypothetical protein